ncbi:MAG: hypothetical protein HYZ53_07215 [Planctomycetes bacterium]|nr:hypothetical protein [Planctomycetota bacterium]
MPRDEAQATTFGGRTPEDGRIDWGVGAVDVDRLVRAATHPCPGAFTNWRDRRLFVWAGEPTARLGPPRELPPGSILGVDDVGLVVATGRGAFRILRCQLEGDDEKDGAEFALENALGPGGLLGPGS